MATIQTARGLFSSMPTQLEDGQQYFCTDTDEIYVGKYGFNVPLKIKDTAKFQFEATYAQLTALIQASALKPGCQYVLTDFVTRYQQPVTLTMKTADKPERLVLTAISNKTFDVQCSSLDFPQDIIWYDFNDVLCEDGTTPRNGFIMRRHDTIKNINCPHDWRTILFARFLLDATKYTVWTSGMAVIYETYYLVQGTENHLVKAVMSGTPSSWDDKNYFVTVIPNYDTNYVLANTINSMYIYADKTKMKEYKMIYGNGSNIEIGDSSYLRTLYNNVFRSSDLESEDIYNITLGNNCKDNTFFEAYYNLGCHNICLSDCSNNIIYESSNINLTETNNDVIGKSNIVNCNSVYNIIMCDVNDITIINSNNNIIGYNSTRIFIGQLSSNTIIGNSCSDIHICSASSDNKIGFGCNNLVIGYNCFNNILGSSLRNLTIDPGGMRNKNIRAITDLQNSKGSIRIQSNVYGEPIYMKLDSNNVPVYTLIP